MVELKFVNSDAKPKVTAIRCDTASMEPIMAWHGMARIMPAIGTLSTLTARS